MQKTKLATIITAFALLYSCQGPHQYGEKIALLYEPAADTTTQREGVFNL
jgi:hypothetical protein